VGGGDQINNGLPVGPGHPWLPPLLSGGHIENGLPPVAGTRPIEEPVEPGTIWPPLPPSFPAGTHAVLVWISGLGYRYAVIEVPEGAEPK
jgi:hypothetical protein